MKKVFIINPKAGNQNNIEIMKIIKKQLLDLKQEYKFRYTNCKGDATKITLEYKNDKDTKIYSVGGDGTLNEVINGIVNTNLKLGIIPIGTGNDFIKTIAPNYSNKIDVIRVNDKYSINIVSFGLDTAVANKVNLMKENNYNGSILYKFALVEEFFKYKNQKLYINNELKNPTILTICNGKYYGGGFKIGTNAVIDDGYLDMYLANNISKFRIPGLLLKLLNGTHDKSSLVNYKKIKNLKVYSDKDVLCNIDGEIIKGNSFDIEVLNKNIYLDYYDEFNLKKILKK